MNHPTGITSSAISPNPSSIASLNVMSLRTGFSLAAINKCLMKFLRYLATSKSITASPALSKIYSTDFEFWMSFQRLNVSSNAIFDSAVSRSCLKLSTEKSYPDINHSTELATAAQINILLNFSLKTT